MMGFRVATMVPMVGVIVLALGLLGVRLPSMRATPSAAAVTVGRFLVMRVAMIFLWLRAARQDQPRPQACLAFAVTTGVVQVGWVTLLLGGTRRRAPDLHYCTGQGGTGILRGSAMPRIMAHDPISAASTQPMNAPSRDAKQIAWGDVGATQEADLAELADWVEGLRAAHTPHAPKATSR